MRVVDVLVPALQSAVEQLNLFLDGCNLYQPQIDQSCSSTGGQTRNLDLGTSDACGTWSASTQYCSGCDLRSREVNSCTGNVRNDVLVQSNSSACGTWNGQNYCISVGS